MLSALHIATQGLIPGATNQLRAVQGLLPLRIISSGGVARPRTARLPRSWPTEYVERINAEDDTLLLIVAQMIASGTIH